MKNQMTVMQRSAMSKHQRMAILSNKLVRRLSNIHREVGEAEMIGVIEQYVKQLKTSGYGRKQTREIVVCGVEKKARKERKWWIGTVPSSKGHPGKQDRGQATREVIMVQGQQQKEAGKLRK